MSAAVRADCSLVCEFADALGIGGDRTGLAHCPPGIVAAAEPMFRGFERCRSS